MLHLDLARKLLKLSLISRVFVFNTRSFVSLRIKSFAFTTMKHTQKLDWDVGSLICLRRGCLIINIGETFGIKRHKTMSFYLDNVHNYFFSVKLLFLILECLFLRSGETFTIHKNFLLCKDKYYLKEHHRKSIWYM